MIKINFDQNKHCIFVGIIIIAIITAIIIVAWVPGLLGIINNETLVVEIIVGVTIASIVFIITQKSQRNIEQKVDSVLCMVREREIFRKKQEKSIKRSLLKVFSNIELTVTRIIELIKDYQENLKDSNEDIKKSLAFQYNYIKKQVNKDIDESRIISSYFIEIEDIEEYKTLSERCSHFSHMNNDEKKNLGDWQIILNTISLFKKKLKKDLKVLNSQIQTNTSQDDKSKEPEKDLKVLKHRIHTNTYQDDKRKEFKKDLEILKISESQPHIKKARITVSVDRLVFPQNSTIHVRVNIDEILENKKILIEVFDSESHLLIHDIINPENRLVDSNIFQTSLKMDGKQWRVDEFYIVRATYDESFSEDVFTIDERMPIIQSDKPMYMIGSDMIVTVIDPDADKDSQKVETVGDRIDAKLIIQSKSGKIDGYRLRETGKSTGVFQGIVGLLEARKDGTIIPQRFGEDIIDKVQGTGIDDGFIGASPGEEIMITYTNSVITKRFSVFIFDSGQ